MLKKVNTFGIIILTLALSSCSTFLNITTAPDAEIFVNQKLQGIGFSKIVLPKNECTLVQVRKEGYVSKERNFCNRKDDIATSSSYYFDLTTRLVKIIITPKSAEILVDGRAVGVGLNDYNLQVPENDCVEVISKKEGFLPVKKTYCNTQGYQKPPLIDHIELTEDEAYKTSVSTDLANVNFTIAVSHRITEGEAWKLLSSIVTTEFDILEVIDKETGYMRTAWQVIHFKESTIRTRIVVKLGDYNPLKYVMKISSEKADGRVSVKDNQKFEEWNRILKRYKNIIEEAQSRL